LLDTLMYTFHMPWPFRALVIGVLLSWGLAPQLACFMPGQMPTQSEMDCCQGMAGDCSGANMSHACCQTVVRTDLGVAAKIIRHVVPRQDQLAAVTDRAPDLRIRFDNQFITETDHAPPGRLAGSSLTLRI
jgi:hypothetical protein